MKRHAPRTIGTLLASLAAVLALASCQTVQPQVTSVGKSVTTLEKFSGMVTCAGSFIPPSTAHSWWNQMPAANHRYPFAGWETFRGVTAGCAQTRIDTFRAVATFNLASAAHLKGLVQKAELVVSTRALPAAAGPGGAVTVGPFGQPGSVTLFCPARLGGAGQLVRFGPNAAVPATTPLGSLNMLGSDPFPSGTSVVYTLPSQFAAGPIANATNPSTMAPDGQGGATITTDVTSQIVAALNVNFAGISWMLTSNFEGPLPGELPAAGTVDCRTSYDFDLRITHL